MADLDALLIPVDIDTWRTFELNTADALGLATTAWRASTPERVIVEINAAALVLLGTVGYEAIRGGFLGYARGEWLTLVAEDTYETVREEASFASATVEFTNVSNTPYPIAAGDRLIIKKFATDVTYAVPGPFVIPSNSTIGGLLATAEIAGEDGSAVIGQISELQDALPGVTVTNTTDAVGLGRETDEDLRSRARLATGPTSPAGPSAAYEYVAKSALRIDGQPVDVNRVALISDINTGSVTAYYASASGPSVDVGPNVNPPQGTVNYEILNKVVPNGIDYQGFSATALPVNFGYEAAVRGNILTELGLQLADLPDLIETYLAAQFSQLPIHGFPVITPAPGVFGILTDSDISDWIGESIRLGGDIEAGIPGQKLLYAVNVTGVGIWVFGAGEVPIIGTIAPILLEIH
jgi:hypothetical protein